MRLSEKKILVIDCQTTGMHPSNGHLLQIGWSIFNPQSNEGEVIEKWNLKLPKDQKIPEKIKKILNITDHEQFATFEPRTVFKNLQRKLKELGPEPIVIAHYAQFEQSFLRQFYKEQSSSDDLNFKLICTQKIAKRVLPNLPSHNLKAIAGYFKLEETPKNEAASHVKMTLQIWKRLTPKLLELDITCFSSLNEWLEAKTKIIKPSYYDYNMDRFTRLKFPAAPGVYRMLTQDKSILYIGKASSLKSRVNSYFRGVKSRDRRILEMLTQVWDIEVIECRTPLEAALLEVDEIKRWTPPYNILLKSDNRKIIFYNYDFNQVSETYNEVFFNGPYKPHDAIIYLIQLNEAFKSNSQIDWFNEQVTPELLKLSWQIFCELYTLNIQSPENMNIRECFLIGCKLLRQFERTHARGSFEKWWAQEKKKNTEDDLIVEERLAHKISRIFIRAAEVKRRSRRIKNLYNSRLTIIATNEILHIHNGNIYKNVVDFVNLAKKPITFQASEYDRLSILSTALNKNIVNYA